MSIPEYYRLAGQYQLLIDTVRQCAPPDVSEAKGVVDFNGVGDFHLNLCRYRVIELAPMATRIGVFMEWRKLFRAPKIYSGLSEFLSFEDAFAYLGVNENWNQPWNVAADTDLSDPYVGTFLESGMALMARSYRCIIECCELSLSASLSASATARGVKE